MRKGFDVQRMIKIEHPQIESGFFEFRKMKAFLEIGVYIDVPGVPHAPIDAGQRYVHSQLLIDLIGVFDSAVGYFGKQLNIKKDPKKSMFVHLIEEGQIVSPQYFKWYKDLRNDSAHKFARHEWHILDQATEHIANQLEHWGLFTATLNFRRYYEVKENGRSYIGARVDDQVIFSYETWEVKVPQGTSSAAGKKIDMPFQDFIRLPSN